MTRDELRALTLASSPDVRADVDKIVAACAAAAGRNAFSCEVSLTRTDDEYVTAVDAALVRAGSPNLIAVFDENGSPQNRYRLEW